MVGADTMLASLLRQDAAAVRAWVQDARTQERGIPGQFNWLGLADAAAFNARECADKVPASLNHYPSPQRGLLRAALLSEQPVLDGAARDVRAWLSAATPALLWAQAAIAAYDLLTGQAAAREGRGFQDSAMNVRAYLIARIGAVPGDHVLDIDTLLSSFFDGLSLTPGEARDKALACKQRLRDREHTPRLTRDLRLLRGIKNRLAPLALVVDSGQLVPSPVLREWFGTREELP